MTPVNAIQDQGQVILNDIIVVEFILRKYDSNCKFVVILKDKHFKTNIIYLLFKYI